MAGLDASQAPLHFVPVLQSAGLDGFRQTLQSILHAVGKALPDGFLLLFASAGAAQNESLFALGDRHLLHFHLRSHLNPIVLQQLGFKLLHLAAWRTHQVLAAAFPDRREILIAHDAAIHYPDAPRLAVFALHHAQNRFHRRYVRPVAVESLITERETLAVDDQRDYHLFTVRTMIARVTAPHHRILLRRTFHIRARQIVEQHVELGAEQLAVALLEMLLQLRFVRQNPVQATVQPRVVDLAFFNPQQIIQRSGWIPALFNRQFAARRAQPVDRQHRRYSRPRHVCLMLIHRLPEKAVQTQTLPQFQTEPTGTELPRPLQSHFVQQHPRHLRIVGRHLDVRWKQLQLLRLSLLVEDFDGLQPPRLGGIVQLTEITERSLPRTVRRPHGLDQRPVRVILAVLLAAV